MYVKKEKEPPQRCGGFFAVLSPFVFVVWKNMCNFVAVKSKYVKNMTSIQRIKSTRMAPYIGLMQELTPEEKRIVVMFLLESEMVSEKKEQTLAASKDVRSMTPRVGWEAAAKQAHADGEDRLMVADVFDDETMGDWTW